MHGSATRRLSRVLTVLHGVRFRATVSAAAVLVVVSAGITVLFFQTWQRSQQQAARSRIDALATLAAGAVAEGVDRSEPARVVPILEGLRSSPGVVFLEVRGPAGPLVTHDERCPPALATAPSDVDLSPGSAVRRATRVVDGTTYLEVTAPVFRPPARGAEDPADAPVGSVRLVATEPGLFGPTGLDARRTAILAVTLVFLGFLGTTFVAGSLAGPIQDLARAAEHAVEGHAVIGTLSSSSDEIGVLARSLERMTERVRDARLREEQWDRELARRIRERTREIQQTNDHLADIVENLGASVLVADLDGTITSANSAVAHVFGQKPDRVQGRNLSEFACAEGVTAASLRQDLEASDDRRSYEGTWRGEGMPERTVLVTHSLLRDFHGEPGAILQVAQDVTELRRMEQELVEANRWVRLAETAREIAHELNEHFTAISGRAETIAMALARGETEHAGAGAARIVEQVGDMRRLTEALQEAGREGGRPELVDLDEAVAACVGLVRSHRRFDGIELSLQRAGATLPVLADPTRIRQVVHNLLAHAADSVRDHHPRGGSIRVETFRESGEVGLRVGNEGTEGHAGKRSRTFEPRPGVRSGDPGFGLAASHRVVTGLGGRMTVRSAPGSGETLTIRLPLAAAAARGDDLVSRSPGRSAGPSASP